MADLAWLNLLLVPSVALLWRISGQLATLTAVQAQHGERITTLERKRA
ncbi:hypothetical protein [Roseateles violae]|uniref:Uncharacterized protein n=1 Tax=Roseateles violae TaxID=3058042 RepID=A0ABT8DT73_9BURK|nr:hypothetical protein [Pelomonas sp. PFR6]MDN3921500.1 hypothetical protein [Pelomonas sp. PFR6]